MEGGLRHNPDRRRRVAALGLISVAVATVVGSAMAESSGPRVKTPHETFDFGIVPQACEVSHVFWLHNTGDEELVIHELIPNCGCTEAPLEKDHVAPGDSTRAEIIFGTGVFTGPVTKFTQVKANAVNRTPALTFKARVYPDSALPGPIRISPAAVRLDDARPSGSGSGYTQTVTLRNTGSSPVAIEMIDRPYADVRVQDFSPIELGPGEAHELTLTFDKSLPTQVFSRSITFAVSDTMQERITLPIFKKKPWEDSGVSGG
ncbi:MAG: hypothetical protein Kow0074_20710 [Candidatus Zixiibacteriota bacterium]